MYAFPNQHNPQTGRQETGMTLRDYFAAHIAGHLSVKAIYDGESDKTIAQTAYALADALLEERNK